MIGVTPTSTNVTHANVDEEQKGLTQSVKHICRQTILSTTRRHSHTFVETQ